jgi:hypothetical protein
MAFVDFMPVLIMLHNQWSTPGKSTQWVNATPSQCLSAELSKIKIGLPKQQQRKGFLLGQIKYRTRDRSCSDSVGGPTDLKSVASTV